MNKPLSIRRFCAFLTLPACALVAISMTSCSSRSEEVRQFEEENGYRQDAYFGTQKNLKRVPAEVRELGRYSEERPKAVTVDNPL